MWTVRTTERHRLREIVCILRLTGTHRAPGNAPSEWTGWGVFDPDEEKQTRERRTAEGLCTRCGQQRPRRGLKTWQRCGDAAAVRSAALRARRKAASICVLRRAFGRLGALHEVSAGIPSPRRMGAVPRAVGAPQGLHQAGRSVGP